MRANTDGMEIVESARTGNVSNKFREAFEVLDTNKWVQNVANGDIIMLDGNAIACSYLVISKDPLSAGTSTTMEAAALFEMPFEVSTGLSMSQRTLGQEFFVEAVSNEDPTTPFADLAISTMSQATTTLTVTTTANHNLRPGMRIGIYGASDSRFNYPALVVASTPTPNQFTATAGPGGTIQSITAGPVTSGYVFKRSTLNYAPNGASMAFENSSTTNASFYYRSESGDALPSGTVLGNHSATLGSTASVQAIAAALTYAFQPTNEYRLAMMVDGVQWSDIAVDSASAQPTNRSKRTQVVPDIDSKYKLRFRAVNNKSLPVPVAKIVSAAKTGTTTATVVTDVAHGLSVNDYITAWGNRDTTNFANLATVQVASIVNATTFTVVWGSAVTATGYGGFIARTQGGQALQGVVSQAIQSVTRTSNLLTFVGSAAWSGVLIGDYVNVHGCRNATNGGDVGVDGPYRIRDINGTSIVLEPIGTAPTGADIGSTNCGGTLIRRTDLRVSYLRAMEFERLRIESVQRPAGDLSAAVPVAIQGGATLNVQQGTVTSLKAQIEGTAAIDAAFTQPVGAGARAANVNPTAMSANADIVAVLATMIGAIVNKPYAIPESDWQGTGAKTDTTDLAVKAAAAAGIRNYVTAVQIQNKGTVATDVVIKDGTTVMATINCPASMALPAVIDFPTPLKGTAATAVNIAALTTGANVLINAQGFIAP